MDGGVIEALPATRGAAELLPMTLAPAAYNQFPPP